MLQKDKRLRSDQTDLGQNGGIEDNAGTTTKYRLLKIKLFFCVCGGEGINWWESDKTQLMAAIHAPILFWHHSENQAPA